MTYEYDLQKTEESAITLNSELMRVRLESDELNGVVSCCVLSGPRA